MKIVYGLLYAFVPALSALIPAIFSLFLALAGHSQSTDKFFAGVIFGPCIAFPTYIIAAIVFCIVKEPKLLLPRVSLIAFLCSLVLFIFFMCIADINLSQGWN